MTLNLSRPFILRPVATVLLMIAILLAGMIGYQQLSVSALPQVDYPTIQIVTFYPGASPDVVTSTVTAPLEKQFGQVPGLTQMSSSSSEGCSLITLRFSLELDIDIAAQQVQAAINVATNLLPRDLPNPPIYTKTNPADAPILTLALSSETLPLSQIEDIVDTRIAQKISQLSGVGLVSISGGQKPAIRIQANPKSLASLGLNLEDLRIALAQANVNQAKGSFDGVRQAFTIGVNDQVLTSEQYRKLIIAHRNGASVHVSDVADVIDGVEDQRQAAWMNETPAVILNIQRQPGANIIEVVDRVKLLLPQLKESLPASVVITTLTDRTVTIRASVEDVTRELGITIILVVLVIFVFLRNVPATLIPSVVVPLSLVGTFAVMYLLKYSLNNLTLMALTISTGFVVDDAIVMIENIIRYLEEGESPLNAALKGSEQIGFTIISLSVSLIAVLIPLLLMGDIVGRLFREFAVTLSVTILVSAIVSLTLTPMMCAKLLKQVPPSRHGWLFRVSESAFDSVSWFYGKTLTRVLQHQTWTMLISVLTLAATVQLFRIVPKGFFPVQDAGVILGISEAPQSLSFDAMADRQLALNRAILTDSAVASLSSFIGIDGTNTTLNCGRILINLKPLKERDNKNATEIIQRLKRHLATVPGITLFMQPVQDLTVETRVTRTQYQYTLEDPDAGELADFTTRLVKKLQESPQLIDVASDLQSEGLQVRVVIDRDTASRFGITPQMIDDALYDSFGQRQVSTMYTQLNQYRLVLEVKPDFKNEPRDLEEISIKTPHGDIVPLSSFARIEETHAPLTVNHQGQFPVVTVSFNLASGVSLGQAVEVISIAKNELGIPPSISVGFQGTAAAFEASIRSTPLLILAAIVTVYLVLGMLYESYIHPITILSTLPSAGVGALGAMLFCGIELSVISLIGIILLIGIVKKNAIMMIDFALDAQRRHQKSPREAIFDACLLRFRPIMMTTMAALLGAVPLALGNGVGSELRRPLGITIIGGLIVSQILTLYTTPVIYLWFDQLGAMFRAPVVSGVPDEEHA